MRPLVSAAFELAGVAVLVAGGWVLAPWIGLLMGGLALILIGLAIDPPSREPKADIQ
ncbi:hypothetical protein [Mycobacteroides abscessus]|uniref:hypothetical protein n=1 Tax=Mycobacteroides abscessus TaxID=36809 RepID=UPI00030B3C40|nr:hypothetical protein [Mycobacteroides abscessus]MDO3068448.1 hypothetical protein [Mycobacteroides abscessus subsp. bolletii]